MPTHRLVRVEGFVPALLATLALGLLVPGAHAQLPGSALPKPRLMLVTPAGAKAGTTVEVVCAGLHLEDPEKLLFSHPAIKAEVVAPPAPEIDPKTKKPKAMPARPTPGTVKLKVTVPAEVPVGVHDLRLVNRWGVSNPRAFHVGDLPEVAEKEPNNETTQAQRVDINTTVWGAMNGPTDVDYFVFAGKKGQRVVVSCLATSVDSRMHPGLEIYNSKDRQIAAGFGYRNADALVDATLPSDGDYYVRVFQFTHTFRQPIPLPGALPPGSLDHFYRLTISTGPWIDAIHPVVVEPGKTTTVTIYGRNLPGGKLDPNAVVDDVALEKATVEVKAPTLAEARKQLPLGFAAPAVATLDNFEYRLRGPGGWSNSVLLALAAAPVVLDKGDNDTLEKAQTVTLPCEIAGVVERRRDRDWYAFDAKKGETWNIDVASNRLGAPTYMTITLRSAAGKGSDLYSSPLQENMAQYDRKFFTRSEDPPAYRFTAPADGTYHLLVTCRGGDTQAGPRHTYRVRITRDLPRFHLAATPGEDSVPDAPLVYANGTGYLTVYAFRDGGFAGDIELSVEGLPPGITCTPQTLNGSVRRTTLVLQAGPGAGAWSGPIKVKGKATVSGQIVEQEARTGCMVWPVQPQQNLTPLTRLDRGLMLAVRGPGPFRVLTLLDKGEVPQGDKATLKVSVDRLWPDFKGPLQLQVMQAPQQNVELPLNLRVNNNGVLNVNPGQKEVSLPITVGADVPPGNYNLVLRAQAQIPYNKDPMAKAKPNTIVVLSTAPATLHVLPKTLANFTLPNPNVNVKIGGQTEVVVRVARRFGYDGEFRVSLVVPPNVKGVEAAEVVIPAGQDEAKLVVRAPADSPVGNRGQLLVRAVALYRGKTPLPHETRLGINVVK